jgi:hypothetical protein
MGAGGAETKDPISALIRPTDDPHSQRHDPTSVHRIRRQLMDMGQPVPTADGMFPIWPQKTYPRANNQPAGRHKSKRDAFRQKP